MNLPHANRRSFQFTLRALLLTVGMVALVTLTVHQQQRIRGLNDRMKQESTADRIVLLRDPSSPAPRIVGYVRGEYVEVQEALELADRRNRLKIRATVDGLTGTVNGQGINCRILSLDPKTGELEVDEPTTWEWIGFDYDAK